ncbi:serine palmitoyltransferase 1-like [Dendronephthya gigantea]|uniref:serine palmitoyltransferase 1-like n=1 Tax=Dendronephthya gigantea TaxID=151771 RepID=UPI00106BFBD4|nr:serine palmitoyltransferase 1-like [Dendronephthya gigantea]
MATDRESCDNNTLPYWSFLFSKLVQFWDVYIGAPFYHILFEVILVLLVFRLFRAKQYKLRESEIHLTEKEEEELIKDWKPEPLVPAKADHPSYVLNPNIIKGKPGHRITVNGKSCLNLATFNFLGFVGDKDIEEASIKSLRKYGVGSCGPRGFYGTIDVHLEFEKKVTEFMNTEDAIMYAYGFSTIASAIPAYSKRGDVIFCDDGVCFAIQKGVTASRSKVYWFKHNNMEDLERCLKEQEQRDKKNAKKASVTRRFLVVEGLYTNYGDLAPLPKLIELKYKYKVRILMDESQSFGVLGATGRGITEHFDVNRNDVDLISASMESSLATIGGFCCGSSFVVDHQRLSGAGYCFSASLPPLLASAGTEALNVMDQHPEMFEKLRDNALLFHKELKGIRGLKLNGNEISPIIHLRLETSRGSIDEDEEILERIVAAVLDKDIAISVARYLKEDEAFLPPPSIRVTVNSKLTKGEILESARTIRDVAEKFLD